MDWLSPSHWLDTMLNWLSGGLLSAFDAIFALLAHGLLLTPDVTGLPQVRALTGKSIWVVDGVFVLFFVAAGVLQIVSGGDERARYTIKDLAPRLVVGFVAAHFSYLLCSQAITLADGLTGAVSGDTISGATAFNAVKAQVKGSIQAYPSPLLLVIMLVLITVLLGMVAVGLLARIGVLIVLTAAAPLGLACHALPQLEGIARLWWRSFAGCLATPVLQAFTLQAGAWMLTDPNMLSGIGIPTQGAAVLNLFVVIVLLWTTVKVPGLVRRYVTQSGRGPNVLGTVLRVVVVQRLTRAVGGSGGGRGTATAGSGRAAVAR